MDQIVSTIRRRIADPARVIDAGPADPYPPTFAAKVDAAEHALGFAIPPVLRLLYTEVANGGFGPGYGLIGVDGCGTDEGGNDLVALFRGYSADRWKERFPRWPDRMPRVVYFGCAMYAAVDCNDPAWPVYLFEPNVSEEELGHTNCLMPYGCGIGDWLFAWANGKNVDFPPSADAER